MLVTPTPDLGKVLSAMQSMRIEGEARLSTAVQIAQLALKHRQNKNQRQRVVIFIGSPIAEDKVCCWAWYGGVRGGWRESTLRYHTQACLSLRAAFVVSLATPRTRLPATSPPARTAAQPPAHHRRTRWSRWPRS